jgi:hypothetical protein
VPLSSLGQVLGMLLGTDFLNALAYLGGLSPCHFCQLCLCLQSHKLNSTKEISQAFCDLVEVVLIVLTRCTSKHWTRN